MASLGDKITVVIDVVTNKATAGLKDFRSAVTEAQGFTGKLKAGVGALKDQFQSAVSSPTAMAAAVTAAGTFAVQAADKFSQLGVEIGKFSDATGLATEDASRYVEVAGDIGISTETLTGVFNKLNKSIDPKTFDQLGISIARTSDGNVNVSETFLNVIDQLNKIQDPARRAEVASRLLGKGWTEVSELVGMSAREIRKQLQAVGDEKVFTAAEIKQARDYRAAMDNLNDAFEKIVIVVGQKMSPAIADAADGLAFLADKVGLVMDAADTFGLDGGNNLMAGLNELANGEGGLIQRATAAANEFADAIPLVGGYLQDLVPDVELAAQAYTGFNEELTKFGDGAAQSQRYLGLLAENTRDSADAAADLTSNARLARAQLKLLQDQIDQRKSFIDLQIQLRENAKRIKEVADDFDQGLISAEEYYTGVASASLDSQAALADYLAVTDEIPETVKTEILAEFDPLNPQKAWQDIQSYFDSHTIQVTTETDRENRRPNGGTPVTGSGGTRQGDVGFQKESVGGFGRGGATVTVNVNAPVGANLVEAGRQIADALRAYYTNGGEPV